MAWQSESNIEDKNALLLEWNKVQSQLAALKAKEAELRVKVVATMYPSADLGTKEGTERLELGNGYQLKSVFKLNYNMGKAEEVETALDKLENIDAEGKFIAERIVKWKPELVVTEYRKLKPKYKKIVDSVLTIKPGATSLEIVPPKGK